MLYAGAPGGGRVPLGAPRGGGGAPHSLGQPGAGGAAFAAYLRDASPSAGRGARGGAPRHDGGGGAGGGARVRGLGRGGRKHFCHSFGPGLWHNTS
eukprot:8741780-Pyramimonas_sp.AAC.1